MPSDPPRLRRVVPALALAAALLPPAGAAAERYGLGRAPTAAELAAWDIAVGPDGAELPAGRGTVADGAALFAARCAACHGAGGAGGLDPPLVGGAGTLAGPAPEKTIGSYWPYATTVFDYVRRAMPFQAPGSLTADEAYSLTAWLLHANGLLAADAVLDATSLPQVAMPNRDGFRTERP